MRDPSGSRRAPTDFSGSSVSSRVRATVPMKRSLRSTTKSRPSSAMQPLAKRSCASSRSTRRTRAPAFCGW
jgi:hypothetical protein